MRINSLIAFIFIISTTGCKVVNSIESKHGFQYRVQVITKEKEANLVAIMDVFIKAPVLVVNMQHSYSTQQLLVYTITCKAAISKNLNDVRDELLNQRGVVNVAIEKYYQL